MLEQEFIDSLEDLTGKVAVVTGGAAGIGLECTIYLARKGCTVYVASRNKEKSEKGIKEAVSRLSQDGIANVEERIIFHQLDLAAMQDSWASAQVLKTRLSTAGTPRLDIVVANAGIVAATQDKLSPDGWERAFATNHLGHYAFTMGLMDLIRQTAKVHGEARIVNVSSDAHRHAKPFDYDAMRTAIPGHGSLKDLLNIAQLYANSKIANVYFTLELDRRLRAEDVRNIYVNCNHPGTAADTGIGRGQLNSWVVNALEPLVRMIISIFSSPLRDVAKTETFLAASPTIRENDVHGQYWTIMRSMFQMGSYIRSEKEELGQLPSDQKEAEKLWVISEAALKKAIKVDSLDIP